MPLIRSLAHVCLQTDDLDKTTAFYCGALGLEKLFDFTRAGKVIGFYLRASPHTFIEVFHRDETAPGTGDRSLHHFCLEATDLEPVRQSLLAKGYAPGESKLGADGSWQFWVQDPGGVDVEFHQYTPQSAQFTGQNVAVNW